MSERPDRTSGGDPPRHHCYMTTNSDNWINYESYQIEESGQFGEMSMIVVSKQTPGAG